MDFTISSPVVRFSTVPQMLSGSTPYVSEVVMCAGSGMTFSWSS